MPTQGRGMAEPRNQPPSQTPSPGFLKKGLIGRLSAVGLFVALGTFAVIQSIQAPAPDDEQTVAEEGAEPADTNDPQGSGAAGSDGPATKSVVSNDGVSNQLEPGKLTADGIRFGNQSSTTVASQKPAYEKPDITGSGFTTTNDNSFNSKPSTSDAGSTDNSSASDNARQLFSQFNSQSPSGFNSGNDNRSSSEGMTNSAESLPKPSTSLPGSFSGNSDFNPASALVPNNTSPANSQSNDSSGGSPTQAPDLLDTNPSSGFKPLAKLSPANSDSSAPSFGNPGSFGSAGPPPTSLPSGSSLSSNDPVVRNASIGPPTMSGSSGDASTGISEGSPPKPASNFETNNASTLAASSTTNGSQSFSKIDSSLPNTGFSSNPTSGGTFQQGGFQQGAIQQSGSPNTAGSLSNSSSFRSPGSFDEKNNSSQGDDGDDPSPNDNTAMPKASAGSFSSDQGDFNSAQRSPNSLGSDTSNPQFNARPIPPHDSLTSQNSQSFNDNRPSKSFDDSRTQSPLPTTIGSNATPSERVSTNPGTTGSGQSNPPIPAHNVSNLMSTTPGERKFEGLQTPSLTLEKVAPKEIQVGRAAKFELIVKNIGNVVAQNVVIHDSIPQGTRLQSAQPQPQQTSTGQLSWQLGTLAPGAQKVIELSLIPLQRGEIGSVATVSFAATAAVRTVSTKPELVVTHRGPAQVLVGDSLTLEINIENRGDGAAENVTIQEEVPTGFDFQNEIRDLEYPIGNLGPGQSRSIKLDLVAKKIGKYQNTLIAFGEGPLKSQHSIDIEVIAPTLNITGDGPKRRYLDRPATHQFTLQNTGTAAATNVEMVARLPRGLQFVAADRQGRYDSRTHTVFWQMPSLQTNSQAVVQLETKPTLTGEQTINFEIAADRNQGDKIEQTLVVEQLAELFFDIDDTADPIELGSETSYRIRVVNQGSKTATNIRVVAEFPQAILPKSISGGGGNEIQGQVVTLPMIAKLEPGEEKSITIGTQGIQVGDHRVIVKVQSDDRSVAESKEESTKVYSDQ
jgi:uncharacterized repeat protein (TIGR01451 family)